MLQEGQIVLFRFPLTDQREGKLRPALVLRKLPGNFDDWLVCMISSQLSHEILGFDECITTRDSDFNQSSLKTDSLIRIGRLAVVEAHIFLGAMGTISSERLARLQKKLGDWIVGGRVGER